MMVKDALYKEIDALSEQQRTDVLSFVRFLRIGLADDQQIEQRFSSALNQARDRTGPRSITDQDISKEIESVRAKQS